MPKVTAPDSKADTLPSYALAATLLFALTPLVDRAHLPIPRPLRWIGAIPAVGGLVLFAASHRAPDQYWTAESALAPEHELVACGPYRQIRHPMYASFFLSALGTLLGLTANWLVSLPLAAVLTHFYLNRVDTEEVMMVDRFGDDNRSYMDRTGRLIPRLR